MRGGDYDWLGIGDYDLQGMVDGCGMGEFGFCFIVGKGGGGWQGAGISGDFPGAGVV